ncbi:Dynein regulatory complex protein 9 [Clonorchis sinensis]|uniref:Dynein regulatory complex protein 9 n=1 Tax=Clonorchis sinensis TaxID=79923 RepID=A0A8T1MWF2_CLOSI|nr:Dynein regulatory complex protein 9 [Clonorchis sinensis]
MLKKNEKNDYELELHRSLFAQLNKVLLKYSHTTGSSNSVGKYQSNNSAMFGEMRMLLEDSYTSPEYRRKLTTHMSEVVELLQKLSHELCTKGTFTILKETLKKEEDQFREMEEIFCREKESREKINALMADIEKSKKDGILLVERSKEMIANLKDQVQELKARSIMEGKYVARCSAVELDETEYQCQAREQQLAEEIKQVAVMRDQESRVASETQSFLRDRVGELNELSKYWQERSKKQVEELRHKLEVLRTSKSKDLVRLRELTNQYQEYEAVVLADRIAAEKTRQQQEQEELEQQAIMKIQNWWRCILVRHNLGLSKKRGKKKKGAKRNTKK